MDQGKAELHSTESELSSTVGGGWYALFMFDKVQARLPKHCSFGEIHETSIYHIPIYTVYLNHPTMQHVCLLCLKLCTVGRSRSAQLVASDSTEHPLSRQRTPALQIHRSALAVGQQLSNTLKGSTRHLLRYDWTL